MSSPLISIPFMVHNRRAQTMATLTTIRRSRFADAVEILICDHGSDDHERLDEEIMRRSPDLAHFEYVPRDRAARNPIRRWNRLFDRCRGQFVMLTSPECLHVGDVVSTLVNCRLQPRGFWRAAACWSADRRRSECIREAVLSTVGQSDWALTVSKACDSTGHREYTWDDHENVWLNHERYRPSFFLSAMLHRDDLALLGGFNEEFSFNVGYEDVDLFRRASDLGIAPVWMSHQQAYLVHQWHRPTYTIGEVRISPNSLAC